MHRLLNLLLFPSLLLAAIHTAAAGELFSGRLDVRGAQPFLDDSGKEDPGVEGRISMNVEGATLGFHGRIEGGWDGTVKRPTHDSRLFKTFDRVYQSNTPWLEVKELFLSCSAAGLDIKAGVQRFAWGRIDEYPSNDLLNPWDFTRFPVRPLEDRKIGVPSLAFSGTRGDWTFETVWLPAFVPYRLALPDERWSGGAFGSLLRQIPGAVISAREPDLPDHSIRNSTIAGRVKHLGAVDWTLNLFHGYDPKPVFRTNTFSVLPAGGTLMIDPGYVPDFHRMTTAGIDAAVVAGDVSLRAEASYAFHRYLNIDHRLWGYPAAPGPGIYPLNPSEEQHDTIDYGIGADYRLFEDGQLTVQGQQTVTLGNTGRLYEKNVETILWVNLRTGFMNQKIDTNMSAAWNPEHRDRMTKANIWYVFSDAWKAGATWLAFTGPEQSFLGRYSRNDQVEAEVRMAW